MVQHIQVGDITPRIQYTGDGIQTVFTYPFPVFSVNDLEVYIDSSLKILNTDYSVTGAGQSMGGSITMIAAPAPATQVTLRRNITIQRTSDFQQSGVLRAQILNDELDQLTAEVQQVDDRANRSLHLKPFDADTNMTLPDKTARQDKVLAFDSAGQPIASNLTLSGLENGVTTAAAAAVAASSSATNAAASAASAATSETGAAASASAAAIAAAANLYATIVNKSASFPVVSTDDGYLFVVDTSGGNVAVALPDIVTDVPEGFRIGFMKSSALNTLTLNRAGTDTINGGVSYVLNADTEIATLVADANAPDNWITFGASTTSAGVGLIKSGATISLDLTADQSWTGSQRGIPLSANSGTFDMNLANNFTCTPSVALTLSFLNETAGQGGAIYLDNTLGVAISLGAEIKADSTAMATLSQAGIYLLGYTSFDGISVALTYSGGLI